MNLDDLDPALMIARGEYATVRAAHEECKKQMMILCGGLGAASAQILRAVQPDDGTTIDAVKVAELVGVCRKAIGDIEAHAEGIAELATMRASLKKTAWSKR